MARLAPRAQPLSTLHIDSEVRVIVERWPNGAETHLLHATPQQAARLLNIKQHRVRQLVNEGVIAANRHGKAINIRADSLIAFARGDRTA